MTAAEMRRKRKGEASMRAKRTSTSLCIRVRFCISSTATGSSRSAGGSHRA